MAESKSEKPDSYEGAVERLEEIAALVQDVLPSRERDGSLMGDLNSRRGHIQAMEDISGAKVVRSLVPLSEMFGYATALRSLTQGRGTFTLQFDHYGSVERKEER